MELPAPDAGVLVKILKVSGSTVTSGEVIAQIDTESKPFPGGWCGNVTAQDIEPKTAPDESHLGAGSGIEFEEFVAKTLRDAGWATRLTKKSGDQGLDLLASNERFRVAIQCKRYSLPVGNAAVQEVHAAADFFGATHAVVVTTSSFTTPALQLAESLGVILLSQ